MSVSGRHERTAYQPWHPVQHRDTNCLLLWDRARRPARHQKPPAVPAPLPHIVGPNVSNQSHPEDDVPRSRISGVSLQTETETETVLTVALDPHPLTALKLGGGLCPPETLSGALIILSQGGVTLFAPGVTTSWAYMCGLRVRSYGLGARALPFGE